MSGGDLEAALSFYLSLDAAVDAAQVSALKGHLKAIHDHVHDLAPYRTGPISSLVVDGLDADQIWAEVRLLNEPLGDFLAKSVRRATRSNVRMALEEEAVIAPEEDEMEESSSSDEDSDNVMDDDDDEDEDDEEEEGSDNDDDSEASGRGGKVPDFFDAEEMERFVRDAEAQAEEGDEEVAALLEEEGDELDDGAGLIGYQDFFGAGEPGEEDELDEFEMGEASEGGDGDASLLSIFERRAQATEERVEQIEAKLVEEPLWALKGEVTRRERPEGSLLEAYVDFDQVMAGAPLLSEEHTHRVEETVKRRVLEGTFDNVARRQEGGGVDAGAHRGSTRVQLDMSKSERGLGDVFEDAYLKATRSHHLDDAADEVQQLQQLPPEHREVHLLFRDVCRSLDALTNMHFRPSAPRLPSLAVRSKDVAAVRLEEVAPVGVSSATMLAPQELGGRAVAVDAPAPAEQTHDDRRKHRRLRKEHAKRQRAVKEAQQQARAAADPVFAAKLRQAKEVAAIGSVRGTQVAEGAGGGTKAGKQFKSTAFFANLQRQVDEAAAGEPSKKKSKTKAVAGGAEKYKL